MYFYFVFSNTDNLYWVDVYAEVTVNLEFETVVTLVQAVYILTYRVTPVLIIKTSSYFI